MQASQLRNKREQWYCQFWVRDGRLEQHSRLTSNSLNFNAIAEQNLSLSLSVCEHHSRRQQMLLYPCRYPNGLIIIHNGCSSCTLFAVRFEAHVAKYRAQGVNKGTYDIG